MDVVRKLAIEQRRRAVAGILGHAEAAFADRLDEGEWAAFREKVMASIGTYHDFILDVIKTGADDSPLNELTIEVRRLAHQLHRD